MCQHEAGREACPGGTVPIPHELDIEFGSRPSIGKASVVDSQPAPDPSLGEQHQKFALTAPDLENSLPNEVIADYQLVSQLVGELAELGAERLALLGGLGVIDQLRVESNVLDEATALKKRQKNVAGRIGGGLQLSVE